MMEVSTQNLKDFVKIWEPVLKVDPQNAELEINPEYILDGVPRNSTVLLVAFEINGPDFSGLISLTYPWMTLVTTLQKLDA